jgi:hypothetical protein
MGYVDLSTLPPNVVERALLAAQELLASLPKDREATARMLDGSVYIVDSGTGDEVDYAYEIHDARRRARGVADIEPVTDPKVAAHYFVRTKRRLADGSGKPVTFRGKEPESYGRNE